MSLTFLTYTGLHPVRGTGPPNPGVAIWTRTENPSAGSDSARAVVVDGSGMYVVGADSSAGGSDSEWRIEKRSLGDGSVIWTQTENPSTGADAPQAIAVDGTGLYVVGYDSIPGNFEWRTEKRSLSTGAVMWTQTENPSTGDDRLVAVAIDGSGVYVVGWDTSQGGSDVEWRIEKRGLSTGALTSTFGTGGIVQDNPSSFADRAQGVTVDATGLYVVGEDQSLGSSNDQWRIEKRDITTGALVTAFGSGGVVQENPSTGTDGGWGAAVDHTGLYVVGYDQFPGVQDDEWRVEKRSLADGSLIVGFGINGVVQENPSVGFQFFDDPYQVAVDGTGIYIAGYDSIPYPVMGGVPEWRIEKRGLSDGAVIWSQTEDPSPKNDNAEGIAVDGTGLYVVGYDDSLGGNNYQWRIEKRNPVLPGLWVVGVQMVQGWNLISLPVVPVSSAPMIALATVMAAGNVTIVWSYTGTLTPTWKSFNPALTSGNTLTAVTDGLGLWALMKAASTLYVEGYVIPPAGSPSQYSLVAGWDLVGFKPVPDPSASETFGTYLTSLPGSSYQSNSVFVYDNAAGAWTRADSGTMINPGQAFWILMLAPAKLAP